MKNGIPDSWFPAGRMRLAEDGFGVRFDQKTSEIIYNLARYHGCSRAEIVRALVNRSIMTLQSPRSVA